MTTHVVSDEQLGVLARRQYDLFRRVREGTLPVELVLKGMQQLIEGNFDGLQSGVSRLIDCDAARWCPWGWKVVEHRQDGQIEFDPNKLELYLSEEQKNGRTIVGHELRKHLAEMPVMNANVLDHLLANPQLIPESWKKIGCIFFWGTVYRDSDGSLCVRCLCWGDGQWRWSYNWLADGWDAQNPAAVSAS